MASPESANLPRISRTVWTLGLVGTFAGIALWGAQMALTQGLLAQLVAERAPESLRGSALGIFNLATDIAMLAASVVAGMLWDYAGPSATLIAGGGFAALMIVFRRIVSRS